MNTKILIISGGAWLTEQALCFIFDRFAHTAFEMACMVH